MGLGKKEFRLDFDLICGVSEYRDAVMIEGMGREDEGKSEGTNGVGNLSRTHIYKCRERERLRFQ